MTQRKHVLIFYPPSRRDPPIVTRWDTLQQLIEGLQKGQHDPIDGVPGPQENKDG